MGPLGTINGDILVQEGRIAKVGQSLSGEGIGCVLDAQVLTIMPGMIDACILDSPQTAPALLLERQSQGVTAGLIWPEEEGPCRIITVNRARDSGICRIQPEKYTDNQLQDCISVLSETGKRPACIVETPQACRRILAAVKETGVQVILARLSGCEGMEESVAKSGCPVILGVFGGGKSSAWDMAVRLDELGVSVCLTCGYPHAKLCHLPLCAALCVRNGLNRERALQMITSAPATLLGLEEAGAIRPGNQADFAIFDGDPLLLATAHVMTISGGKMIH